jgi:hypothetical protein
MGPRAVALARLAAASGVMPRLGADCIQVPIRRGPVPIVTRRFVESAHGAGLPVHVWTIDDERTIEELLDLGVDGIMSNRLKLLENVFGRRGCRSLRARLERSGDRDLRGGRSPVAVAQASAPGDALASGAPAAAL